MVKQSKIREKFFELVDKFIKNEKLSHSYLIELNNYEEDFLDVLQFVKMIFCNCTRNDLSNENMICRLIDSSNYPDLKIIEADGQWIKKNQLIELMDDFHNKSLFGNRRVYIIKETEKLNTSSANTILKFLEEPEDGIIAILLTKNRFQVIDTILSRCQILNLSGDFDFVEGNDDSKLLLTYILQKKDLFINYNRIINDIIPDKNVAKKYFDNINYYILQYINYISNKNYECSEEIISIFKNVDAGCLANILAIIEEEISKLEYNINYKLWVDSLFARIILGGNL